MYLVGVRCFLFFGYGSAPFFFLLRILKCKIICNPDGIEWKRPESKIKKLYFKICEKIISKIDITRIYDSKVIQRYYHFKYGANGKTIYYPSVFENLKNKNIKSKKKKFQRFYILGRLLEENNTEMIVQTFSRLDINKKLYIIGKSNNFFEKIIRPYIIKSKNIIHIGPIYDQDKLYKICSLFDFYVHGHSVGGTNPTLIEAVSLGKPIIAFRTSFNHEILKDKASYFKNSDELYNIIKNKLHLKIKHSTFKEEFKSNYINDEYFNLISN